jgi:hypothetical protein
VYESDYIASIRIVRKRRVVRAGKKKKKKVKKKKKRRIFLIKQDKLFAKTFMNKKFFLSLRLFLWILQKEYSKTIF